MPVFSIADLDDHLADMPARTGARGRLRRRLQAISRPNFRNQRRTVSFETDRRRIEALGRPAASALRVHELLQTKPIIAIPDTAKRLGISAPTVAKSVQHLVKIGIAREITGKQRRRIFAYPGYLRIIERGTKPISK